MINSLKNYYFFTAGITLGMMVLLLVPLTTLPKIHSPLFPVDKLVHFILFTTWMLSFLLETKQRLSILSIFIIGICLALSTELLQLATKNRQFDIFDAMYDTTGLLVGRLLYGAIVLVRRNKKPESDD